jgi:hypothetical protein
VVPISEKAVLEKMRFNEIIPDVWYIHFTPDFTGAKVIRKDKESVEMTFGE